MTKMRNLLLPTLVGACLVLTGCMTSPLDGQWYNKRDDEIEFGGFLPAAYTVVTIEAWHREFNGTPQGWSYFTQAASVGEPLFTDPTNPDVKWYHWSAKARVGKDFSIWESRNGDEGSPGYSAQFRAFIGEVSQPYYLPTFRDHFGRCLNGDHQYMCGGPRPQSFDELLGACGTGTTVITVNAFD